MFNDIHIIPKGSKCITCGTDADVVCLCHGTFYCYKDFRAHGMIEA